MLIRLNMVSSCIYKLYPNLVNFSDFRYKNTPEKVDDMDYDYVFIMFCYGFRKMGVYDLLDEQTWAYIIFFLGVFGMVLYAMSTFFIIVSQIGG